MSEPNPDQKSDETADPNRDRDKPQYPAPPGAGEGGTGRNPQGAGGIPPGVTVPAPTAPAPSEPPEPTKP